jgi:hypothetical protein
MLDLGRLTATSVINAHVNVAGLCASCEHVRPCELVVLAERNLAAIGVPPELGRSGDRASSHSPRRPSTLHGAAMWPRAGAQTCRGPEQPSTSHPPRCFRALAGDEMERVDNRAGVRNGIGVSVLFQPRGVGRASRLTPVPRTLR